MNIDNSNIPGILYICCIYIPSQIKPTRPNQWLWHPFEWYEERLLKAVEDLASSSPWVQLGRGCPLSVLEENVMVPPPLGRYGDKVASEVSVTLYYE